MLDETFDKHEAYSKMILQDKFLKSYNIEIQGMPREIPLFSKKCTSKIYQF
jgi:hypothetical protein